MIRARLICPLYDDCPMIPELGIRWCVGCTYKGDAIYNASDVNNVNDIEHIHEFRKIGTWWHPQSNVKIEKYVCDECGIGKETPVTISDEIEPTYTHKRGVYNSLRRAQLNHVRDVVSHDPKTEHRICQIKNEKCYDGMDCINCTDPKIKLIKEREQKEIDDRMYHERMYRRMEVKQVTTRKEYSIWNWFIDMLRR